MGWLRAILDLAERLLRWFFTAEAIAAKAEVEQAAEIAEHDRKRANEIRDRVDSARLGGGLHPKPNDTRGYRD